MKSGWILVILLITALALPVLAQAPADSASSGEPQGELSVGKWLDECGVFKWPLISTLFFGLSFSLYRLGMLILESARSRRLYVTDLAELGAADLARLIRERASQSEMGQLLGLMFAKFQRGEGTEDLYHSEVAHSASIRRDRFGTYRTWTMFFSDAAGALGLLGTVVGMYQTFFGGKLQESRILAGMAIALATTIIGLINSLILTAVMTGLSHMFDRQMEQTTEKADELRHVLRAHEERRSVDRQGEAVR